MFNVPSPPLNLELLNLEHRRLAQVSGKVRNLGFKKRKLGHYFRISLRLVVRRIAGAEDSRFEQFFA